MFMSVLLKHIVRPYTSHVSRIAIHCHLSCSRYRLELLQTIQEHQTVHWGRLQLWPTLIFIWPV